ncbi:hypothetical protein A4R26_24175 [Niastella populi]|uniref:Uncharacterized protein n=2 Tax=Niastella populi TaxID=550983 RepID=A0A1V9FGI2_9BACT|nr:hypothetical protein A4R26_24175 [Niastella populi]
MGRIFDQQHVIEAERTFVNNDFSELPHLQQYKDQGYEIATGQVKLKTPVTPGTKVEVRPDCMFFKVDTRGRVILAEPGIWQECKIRRSSPLTENQETVIEMLINGQLNNTQIVFEVGTSRLQDIGLPKGTTVTIDVVNQISI